MKVDNAILGHICIETLITSLSSFQALLTCAKGTNASAVRHLIARANSESSEYNLFSPCVEICRQIA